MKYFLIVYDQAAGQILEIREYRETERKAALEDRFSIEQVRLGEPSIEVVLLGSESRSDLERTHARYFKSITELAEGS